MSDDPITPEELRRLRELRRGKPPIIAVEQEKYRNPLDCTEYEAERNRRAEIIRHRRRAL